MRKAIAISALPFAIAALLAIAVPARADKVTLTISMKHAGAAADAGKTEAIKIECRSVSFSVDSTKPHDAGADSMPGRKGHNVVTIRKELDASSPKLLEASNRGEPLDATFTYFKEPGNTEVERIKLTNALITRISNVMVKNTNLEDVSFTFQKIEWTWVKGGITATDDWLAP
jgi:type VI secretion system secreted protein Hcp